MTPHLERIGRHSKFIGLILGVSLFLLVLTGAAGFGLESLPKRALAVTVITAVFWVFEVLPIPITSLLPAILFPILGVLSPRDVAPYYMHDILFLFIGGFMLAGALEKWDLHRRIALKVIVTVGMSPKRLVFGFLIASAGLSMWILNTATALMLTPIVIAVVNQMKTVKASGDEVRSERLVASLLMAVAFGSSVGGVGTLIGTAPNGIAIGILSSQFPDAPTPTFFEWMRGAVPFVVLMLPIIWFILTRSLKSRSDPAGLKAAGDVLAKEYRELGKWSRGEKWCLAIFSMTVFGWVFREDLVLGVFTIPGWQNLLPESSMVSDATTVCFIAVLAFLIPVEKGEKVMDWQTANRAIPWGVLLLFGAGFALAGAFRETGLSDAMSRGLQSSVSHLHPILVGGTVGAAITFLTEVTSNTATTSVALPVLATAAVDLQLHPLTLMLPATIAASCAFMLPVATPPNAIVFATGRVSIPRMAIHGFFINIATIIILTTYLWSIGYALFGIDPSTVPDWAKSGVIDPSQGASGDVLPGK